ncbi:MAG: hypothetical protein IPL76_03915 [Gemmatimonadetes bacterium]|nr:hypothetical protein [Gemmatimonadota bacterium]
MQHWFTWRKAIRGGLIAFGVLALVAGGYTAMRLAGIGPAGTLVASGRLKAKDRMIVADFETRTSDPGLAGSITEAFRIDWASRRWCGSSARRNSPPPWAACSATQPPRSPRRWPARSRPARAPRRW